MPSIDVELRREDIDVCVAFARECAPTHMAREYGQDGAPVRDSQEIARDILIGKPAELALSRLLADSFGLDLPVDLENYGAGAWDAADGVHRGWRIDVKGTKRGRWLLADCEKMRQKIRDDEMPHIYVLGVVPWDEGADRPFGRVSLLGYAYLDEMVLGVPGSVYLQRGAALPGTREVLQANNLGRRADRLHDDWAALAKRVSEESAFSTGFFTLPGLPLRQGSELVAKYSDRCGVCGDDLGPGDPIARAKLPGGRVAWAHARCTRVGPSVNGL